MSFNKLSKKLAVGKPSQAVVYRLLTAGQKNPFTGRPMYPSGYGYSGIASIYDEGDEENPEKTIIYQTGTKPLPNGAAEPIIGRIDWGSTGTLTVQKNQQSLFEFMERDNRNASNPFRNKSVQPLYERVDEEATAKEQNAKIDLELDALLLIKTMDGAELVRYAKALDVDTNRKIEQIIHDMRVIARRDPKTFIDNASSILMKVRAEVKDAVEQGILEFDAADNKYIWRKEKNALVIVPRGTDELDFAVNFLVSDKKGEVAYKEIVKRLAAANTK